MATLRDSRIVVPQGLAAVNGTEFPLMPAETCQKLSFECTSTSIKKLGVEASLSGLLGKTSCRPAAA